ncbi:MAG: dynamin family protein [Xenococcaceae cyanobacterium MO_188.B32]|nr:dynamin family protein [Xenococcaceae cyanobacterium MO_188.B32]
MVSTPENSQPQNLQYLQYLQSDVIKLLQEISALMVRTQNNLRNDNSGNKYGYFRQEVDRSIYNVENLELRMAIVAPMKAGKSTIINAIVGQDLLPSRNAAMTTIPTKIVFNAKREKPILILKQEIISIFEDAWNSLQTQMNNWGIELTSEKIAHYPHLKDLVTQIRTNRSDIEREITDKENISRVLTKLNDIVRLASTLDPDRDPLAKLVDLPCIETPFWNSETNEDSQYLGDLVIVDTPGPNEARDNLVLTAVVEQELKQSSIVLIVLDFTQLNNQAAEAVKKQVQPVIDLIGKENLYVLINKVDQRRQGDMTTEQVKDFVYADLNLSESSDSDRIFEISARQAFSATKFLLELQQNSKIDIPTMETGEILAQEVLGIDWEEELETIKVEELKRKANKLLKKSGFTPFLKKAIKALRKSAALKCISSALNRCHGLLRILKNDLNLRINIIFQEAKKIEEEITALTLDLEELESCCNRLKEVDNIKSNLQVNLSELIEQLKEKSLITIGSNFDERDFEKASFVQKIEIRPRKSWFANLDEDNTLPKFITEKLKDGSGNKTSNIIEFPSQNEARNFIIKAVAWAKGRSEDYLQIACQNTGNIIQQSQQELIDFFKSETRDILEKIFHFSNKAFEVELSFSTNPQINERLSLGDFQIGSATRQVIEYQTKKYRPWYFLWLIELTKKIPITKTESYYIVSLEELINEVNNSTETSINKISEEIPRYLDKEFQPQIERYLTELNAYFGKYRNSLIQAKQERELSLAEKNTWVEQLNALGSEAEQKLTETNNYIEQTKQYL